jgi:hypothetical protein
MPSAVFDPAISHTYALDRAATGIGDNNNYNNKIIPNARSFGTKTLKLLLRSNLPLVCYYTALYSWEECQIYVQEFYSKLSFY